MRQGPHNIYISRWLDNGLIGLVCFLGLLAAVGITFWKRRYTSGLVFIGVLVIEGFFSHNLLEERAFLVLLGTFLTLSFFSATEPIGIPVKGDSRTASVRRPGARASAPRASRPNGRQTSPGAASGRLL
jgi:O-antigen ligase